METDRFRLRSKKLFLTYPKCPLSPEEALPLLSAIVSATGHVIATEKHADGTDHLHVYLESEQPMSVNGSTTLDLVKDGARYHGNYQSVRSRSRVMKYVTKEGNFISNIDLPSTPENPWIQALTVASTEGVKRALELLEENPKSAMQVCVNGDRIRRNLAGRLAKRLKITYELPSFGWTINWENQRPSTRTLLLFGNTNCGKTALAKALLPEALLISHIDQLREFDPERNTGIIFDDMSFKHMPREGQIHLVDRHQDRAIHVRYGYGTIPEGEPVIITTNLMPESILLAEDPAIARRILCVNVRGIGQYFEQP